MLHDVQISDRFLIDLDGIVTGPFFAPCVATSLGPMECVLRFDRWVPFMRPQEMTMTINPLRFR